MRATLVQWGWLQRTLEIEMADGTHVVEYNGTGFGYEQVTADGATIRDSHPWFVPRFDFKLGDWPAAIEVRLWPWLTLRSFALLVKGKVIYAEGLSDAGIQPTGLSGDWCDLA